MSASEPNASKSVPPQPTKSWQTWSVNQTIAAALAFWSANEVKGSKPVKEREEHCATVSYPFQITELKRVGLWDPARDGEAHDTGRTGSALRQRTEQLVKESANRFFNY